MNENEILRMTTALGDGKDAYYVYMLCENTNGITKPFYIGKGIGNRVLQHELGAGREISERTAEIESLIEQDKNLSDDEKLQQKSIMIDRMREDISKKYQKIDSLGSDNVIKVIVKWGLTESEAFMAESTLINAYSLTEGRNELTNIVNGHMSDREKQNISCTTKAYTLQEFLDECAAPKKVATEIKEPVLFLKIKGLYPLCMQEPKDKQEQALYDACRACWILSRDKIKHIKYVFALYNSQVVGIYKVSENNWKQRFEIDDSFPAFPKEKRDPEIHYGKIAKNCSSLSQMKEMCDNFEEFLYISAIDEDDDNGFNAWKNRYYFNKCDDELPDDIASFKNSILIKPDGEKFFSGRGNQSEKMYNFDVVKGKAVIKTAEDYEKKQ